MNIESVPITQLLERWKNGDRSAEEALITAVYPLLRNLAAQQIRKNGSHLTLGATDLAHEAYLRLQEQNVMNWQNREHFYAIAATVVRRVVIDYLRERFADKRGGGKLFIPLDAASPEDMMRNGEALDWFAVDQALNKLESLDADCARIVELKLFSILSADQIANVCKSSVATVGRQWRFAKSWLAVELENPGINDAS